MRISDWSSDVCSSDLQRCNHACTVSCHCTLLCGFRTQWFSSGNTSSSDAMPRRCSAVNAAMPCSVGMRKSFSPWMTSIGVFQRLTWLTGLNRSYASGLSYCVAPFSHSSNQSRSEEHTSELHPLLRNSYAVVCLKKKNKHKTQ